MPTVMAQAVIKIGRKRSLAPTMAASVEDAPAFQCSSMNVTIITELDTDTPRHMIEPMNDSMFSVVLVAQVMLSVDAKRLGEWQGNNVILSRFDELLHDQRRQWIEQEGCIRQLGCQFFGAIRVRGFDRTSQGSQFNISFADLLIVPLALSVFGRQTTKREDFCR